MSTAERPRPATRPLLVAGDRLDPVAMSRRDLGALFVGLDHGLSSVEHATFVAELARRRDKG